MNDNEIVELYHQRSELAISESRQKYGAYCGSIAQNILHCTEDTEECVNDTWSRAWNSIPPARPVRLSVFLGKITRNLALDRWRRRNSAKNGGGQTSLCLDELSECVSDGGRLSEAYDLKAALESFLRALKPETRRIFMLRYWYMLPVKEVARQCGNTEAAVKMSLSRTRAALREHLTKEGLEP